MPLTPLSLWNRYNSHYKRLKDKKGNVLFIILLAVGLFAALSYAVTQSTRSGGGDASTEQNTLYASNIIQYGSSISTAIIRMRISNGCTDTQISFENPTVSGYANPNAPVDYRCHVFRPEGGGVAWQRPPNMPKIPIGGNVWETGQYFYSTYTNIPNIGLDCGNASCTEVYLWLRTTNKDVCMAYNKQSNVINGSSDAPLSGGLDGGKFIGTHIYGNIMNGAEFVGKQSGCHRDSSETDGSGNPYYDFYYVLMAR